MPYYHRGKLYSNLSWLLLNVHIDVTSLLSRSINVVITMGLAKPVQLIKELKEENI